jgi:hypothetical protein
MKAKLLQMPMAKTTEVFSRSVPTVEANVNFTVQSVANEDGSDRLCVPSATGMRHPNDWNPVNLGGRFQLQLEGASPKSILPASPRRMRQRCRDKHCFPDRFKL